MREGRKMKLVMWSRIKKTQLCTERLSRNVIYAFVLRLIKDCKHLTINTRRVMQDLCKHLTINNWAAMRFHVITT